MGCVQYKRENYVDVKEDEERGIREFEQEIGGFTKSLNEILPKICVEREIIQLHNVEEFILRDFHSTFLSFIQKGYFYKNVDGINYYDAKKVILLIFLLTKNDTVNNGFQTYNDKASFILHFIRSRNDHNLTEPITENEENFFNFINDLVDVACNGIVDCYVKQRKIQRDGYLIRLKEIKKDICEVLINFIFKRTENQRTNVLSFETLNKLFDEDKFFLNSGFIREIGWNILINGKAQEMDKKDAEAEKQTELEIKN
jgi:hypothetical protein